MKYVIRILILCGFALSLWIIICSYYTPIVGDMVSFVEPELGEVTLESKIVKQTSEGFCLEVPGYPYEIFLGKDEIEGNELSGFLTQGSFQNGRELKERQAEDCGFPQCFSENYYCDADSDYEPIYH